MRRRQRRSNPGISGIVMNGVWVGIGMWAGGMVNGFIGGFTSPLTSMLGPFGGIAQALITAYVVEFLGNRTIGHGDLMAAGAFGGTAVSTIQGLIGSATSLVSSAASSATHQ